MLFKYATDPLPGWGDERDPLTRLQDKADLDVFRNAPMPDMKIFDQLGTLAHNALRENRALRHAPPKDVVLINGQRAWRGDDAKIRNMVPRFSAKQTKAIQNTINNPTNWSKVKSSVNKRFKTPQLASMKIPKLNFNTKKPSASSLLSSRSSSPNKGKNGYLDSTLYLPKKGKNKMENKISSALYSWDYLDAIMDQQAMAGYNPVNYINDNSYNKQASALYAETLFDTALKARALGFGYNR